MKMQKAEFIETVITLLDSGCTHLNVFQYPGLKTTELVYLSRNGERKSMKLCDSATDAGRDSQRVSYSNWLDHAQKSWKGVLNALDVKLTYQEACSLVRLTLRNLVASREMRGAPTIHSQDITRVLVILAQDIFSGCTDNTGAQALSDLLASTGFNAITSSGVELHDALKAFILRADEEMMLINDRKIENQLDAMSVLRVALCQLTMVINDEMVFTPKVNARLEKIKKRMFARCQDEAFQNWFGCHWISGYFGDAKVKEILQPLADLFAVITQKGKLPEAPAHLTEQEFYDREWSGVDNVKTTYRSQDGIYHGYGEFSDIEGVIKIRIKWSMDTGEEAIEAGVLGLVRIEEATLRVPEKLTLTDQDGKPVDLLEAVQEVAWQENMTDDIVNAAYDKTENSE